MSNNKKYSNGTSNGLNNEYSHSDVKQHSIITG
jgi:hypothetical protein